MFYINCIRIFFPFLKEKIKGIYNYCCFKGLMSLLKVTLCIHKIPKLNIMFYSVASS